MIIIFIIASGLFFAGVAADASSSSGMLEKTKFFRDKNGIFDLRKYLLSMAALWAACLVITLLAKDTVTTTVASGILVLGAVLRFRIAGKNRALRKSMGK